MSRQWINIRGRNLLWKEFIHTLDSYRYSRMLNKRGDEIFEKFACMIYVLQRLTDNYRQGKNYIEYDSEFYEDNYMEMPSEKKLPDALEELLKQIELKLNIDLTEMLDQCVLESNKAYMHMQELQRKEEQRILLISSLMEENNIDETNDDKPESRISKLLLLQKAKLMSDLYDVDEDAMEKEMNVAKTWCEVLASSVFSEVISYGLMLRLVENEIATEFEMTDLLQDHYNRKEDFEWYSENFLGCKLDWPTDIRVEDILSLYAKKVEKIIGTRV